MSKRITIKALGQTYTVQQQHVIKLATAFNSQSKIEPDVLEEFQAHVNCSIDLGQIDYAIAFGNIVNLLLDGREHNSHLAKDYSCDLNISHGMRCLMNHLARFCSTRLFNKQELSDQLGISELTVGKNLESLVELGYITTEKVQGGLKVTLLNTPQNY